MGDDDDDLEQELLAVAGRNRPGKRARGKAASESEFEEDDDDDDEDDDLFGSDSDDGGGRGGGRKATRNTPAKRGRKAAEEEEEEEDGEEEEDEDEGGYGSDLYIDDEDREKLGALNELQREIILAERAEERDKQRQRKSLLKSAKDGDKDKTRGAAASRLAPSRARKETARKDSALRQIQAARKRQSKKAKGKGRRGSGAAAEWSESDDGASGSGGDEDDESDESDVERPAPSGRRRESADGGVAAVVRPAAVAAAEEELADMEEDDAEEAACDKRETSFHDEDDENAEDATLEELLGAQVTRAQLEAWCDKPFFNGEGLNGAVVRMAYGQAAAGQAYMLMVVHDVKVGGKPYPFGARATPTNKYLVLIDGANAKHTMSMQNVSNSPLLEAEYERFVRHCSRSTRRMLTKQDVRDARKKIDAAESYRWDASKVREVIERKRAAGQLPANVAAEKARLKRLIEDATTRGAAEEVSALEERMLDVEARGQAVHPGNTRMYAMGDLNKRNMRVNFNNAFTNVSNKPAGATDKGGADPFSRRNTRPSIYWNTKGAEATAAEQAQLAQAKLNFAASAIAVKASMAAAKLSARQMKLDPAQLIRQLDIGVDLSLLAQPTLPQLSKRLLGRNWTSCLSSTAPAADASVLSIQDWKQRAYETEQQG
ncbi:hypothetical protein FOA52_002457 [Chlamydomonas sp. UWO 241]|nr:hypothetical protein FOA52_002457 [Chlamydomonas sp. UWO 241]